MGAKWEIYASLKASCLCLKTNTSKSHYQSIITTVPPTCVYIQSSVMYIIFWGQENVFATGWKKLLRLCYVWCRIERERESCKDPHLRPAICFSSWEKKRGVKACLDHSPFSISTLHLSECIHHQQLDVPLGWISASLKLWTLTFGA